MDYSAMNKIKFRENGFKNHIDDSLKKNKN